MRAAIRQRLIDQVASIEGRVFEPHAAGADTPKPFVVLRQGIETEETIWTGFRRIVEVWPYIARTSFQALDALVNEITKALDKHLLTDDVTREVFSCLYLGTVGQDYVDEGWNAITRGLRFAVVALQPVNVTETIANDTWLAALATWTETKFGAPWTVYQNFWPLGYKRPSVMWRLGGITPRALGKGMFEVRKSFAGHIVGDTPNRQISGTLSIIQGLASDIKIVLDAVNRRYLTVHEPAADLRTDAITAGQISVTLSRITNRPELEAPLIGAVHVRDDIE